MVDKTISTFGKLDIAFNNAGVHNKHKAMHNYSFDDWNRIISINLKGVWACMKYELQYMLEQGAGSIIKCSSIGGYRGSGAGEAAYISSKHGVIGLTRAAALGYAKKGIRINSLAPGMTDTAMTQFLTDGNEEVLNELKKMPPMARFGTPEELANAVLWLASSASSYVTGHTLVVDGGITA